MLTGSVQKDIKNISLIIFLVRGWGLIGPEFVMQSQHENCALVLCWSLPSRQCLVPSSLALRTNLPHSLVWLNLPSVAEWTAVFISWSMADFCNYIWFLSNLPEFLKFPESLWALCCLIIHNTFAHLFFKGFFGGFHHIKGEKRARGAGTGRGMGTSVWGCKSKGEIQYQRSREIKSQRMKKPWSSVELCCI